MGLAIPSHILQEKLRTFITASVKETLFAYPNLQDEIKAYEDTWLTANMVSRLKPGQYLFPKRPSETDGLVALPRIAESKNKTPQKQEEDFYEILGASKILDYCQNGAWNGNNCMFAAIAHYPEVIKEIVAIFGQKEKLNPDDPQFTTGSDAGGKTLRRITCQWILDNMDRVLFQEVRSQGKEKGGMPELTVRDIINSIGLQKQGTFDPTKYIQQLQSNTDFIDEGISVIISILIDRPIIVLTETSSKILTSRLGNTFLTRKTWRNPPIYLHNNSRANGAASYSGSHYSGLKIVAS